MLNLMQILMLYFFFFIFFAFFVMLILKFNLLEWFYIKKKNINEEDNYEMSTNRLSENKPIFA
jgi:hypothetical protein